ncbi:Gfo/Idh/MocA family oxidoreductase [Chelativorans sp.]|uniref:Gfo/Idh/MocA family protein n=1 Tax=Chelativorans sp. TaxID=2203393 RepID=UPI002810FA54|nr:Gfo/Idh/MocA family oxidoreductase [Chelativorans sp.]
MNESAGDSTSFGWGIVGTGAIAHQFAADLAHAPGARLAAVQSRSPDKAQAFAERFPYTKAYGDLDALLADPDIRAVYIATPNALHAEQALRAIEAGKPVLIEKPVGVSSGQAQAIESAAREQGVFAMEAMWSRFLPAIRHAREIVLAGAIGTVKSLRADLSYYRPQEPGSRFFAPDGGGAALDLGVYPLSLAIHFLGLPERVSGAWQAVQTGVDLRMRFELFYPGAKATVSCGLDRTGSNLLAIEGSEGTLQIHAPFLKAQRISVYSAHLRRLPLLRQDFRGLNRAAKLVDRIAMPGHRLAEFPFPGGGLQFQAMAAMEAIGRGETSCPVMPLAQSAAVLRIIETVRANGPVARLD